MLRVDSWVETMRRAYRGHDALNAHLNDDSVDHDFQPES